MTISPSVELFGVQTSRYLSVPPAVTSAGQEAVELAASAGLILDEAQQLVLDGALGERRDGQWAAFEVAVVEPRQNGKGSILEARELAGLFLFGEQLILHSAHEFKTAQEAFRRVLALVQSSRDLERRVLRVRTSHGEEGIELRGGQRLRFVARSTGSGRGFTGDLVILDEAYNLLPAGMAALLPTLSARPNPQLWYTSSAPLATSIVLRKLCRRGRGGLSRRLAYFEWSADTGPADQTPEQFAGRIAAALDDRQAWAQANPALGDRISVEFVEAERQALDDEEFGRERLGIWRDEAAERFIGESTWDLVNDPDVEPVGELTYGLDVNPERSAAAIVAIGDGAVEVIEHRAKTGWLVDRVVQLDQRRPGSVWVVDGRPSAPIASFVPKLRDAGLTVHEAGASDVAAACGDMFDDIVEQRVRFRRHPSMDRAVEGLVKRDVGDGWVWDRKGSEFDISPFYAATLARWMAPPAYDVLDSVR